jgi:hypothetical protein
MKRGENGSINVSMAPSGKMFVLVRPRSGPHLRQDGARYRASRSPI